MSWPLDDPDAIASLEEEALDSLAMEGPAPFTYEGITYPSIANGYYRYINLPNHWALGRLQVMYRMNHAKFEQNTYPRDVLLWTCDRYLADGRWFDHTHWGVDLRTGAGSNWLGRILMHIREELQTGQVRPFCLRSKR